MGKLENVVAYFATNYDWNFYFNKFDWLKFHFVLRHLSEIEIL